MIETTQRATKWKTCTSNYLNFEIEKAENKAKKMVKKDASSYNILFLVCRPSESGDAFMSAQKSIADDVLHPRAWFICVIQKLNNVNGMDFIRNAEKK